MFIGDLHGFPVVKELESNDDFHTADEVIFLGDYFDAYKFTNAEELDNFGELVSFIRSREEGPKFTLLMGNHDVHYFLWRTRIFRDVRSSGFSSSIVHKAHQFYKDNTDLFHVAWQYKNILATHAGISNNSYHEHIAPYTDPVFEGKNLAFKLNFMFRVLHPGLFAVGQARGGMWNTGGVFWADRRETMTDPLKGYCQVVGHSMVPEITTVYDPDDPETSITYTDVLTLSGEFQYYTIEF